MLKVFCLPVVLAVSATKVSAACVNPPISAKAIRQFKSNPMALAAPDPGARTIEATVRDLAGTDASLAADLILVAKGTSPRFRTVDQHAAQSIQEAVASFHEGQFQSAFAAVAGDLSTAATAAANAFASASVGGGGTLTPIQLASAVTSLGGLTLVNPSTKPTPPAGANPVSATR